MEVARKMQELGLGQLVYILLSRHSTKWKGSSHR